MIVDSSALLALLFREPGSERIEEALARDEPMGMGAPTYTETAIVLAGVLGEEVREVLALLVEDLDLVVLSFSAEHGREAREAFLRYGRGRHSAALNFGDCMTYAVAKLAGQPLLFVGNDFLQTDLEPALDPSI